MRRSVRGLAGFFWLASVAVVGAAAANAVDVRLKHRALLGEGVPQVEIAILEPISGFRLVLTRSDGHRVDVKGAGKPGTTRSVRLEQPEGRFSYTGELTVDFPNGDQGTLPLAFDAELLAALRLELRKQDVDLDRRRVTFRLSRPAQKAHLRVLMDTGEVASDREVPLEEAPAGTPLTVDWPAAEGRVMKISIRAWDTSSFYTGVEISPWRIDVPHEEVHFATGSAEVRVSERPKLDASYRDIAEAVRRYGKLAEIKLYIAGHTDTVGAPDANRALSLARARSIGAYFRSKGLRLPILYEGFGEEALRISTTDEHPEEANRRVEYILAIDDPTVQGEAASGLPFVPRWRPL